MREVNGHTHECASCASPLQLVLTLLLLLLFLLLAYFLILSACFPASFVGHLAGIVVGFPLSWGWLNGSFSSLAPWACATAIWHCKDLLHPTRHLQPAAAAVVRSFCKTIARGLCWRPSSVLRAAARAYAAVPVSAPVPAAADIDDDDAYGARYACSALTFIVAGHITGLLGGFMLADSLFPPEAGWAILALAVVASAASAHPPPNDCLCRGPVQPTSVLPTTAPSLLSAATSPSELLSSSVWPLREDRQRLLLTAAALSWFLAISSFCTLAALAARWPVIAGGLAHREDFIHAEAEENHAGIFSGFSTPPLGSTIGVSLAAAIWLPFAHFAIAIASAWVLTIIYPETATTLRSNGILPSIAIPAVFVHSRPAPVAFAGTGIALGSSSGNSTAATATATWQLRGGGGAGRRGRGGRGGYSQGRSSGNSNSMTSAPLSNPWA